jgi:hypothetical protein
MATASGAAPAANAGDPGATASSAGYAAPAGRTTPTSERGGLPDDQRADALGDEPADVTRDRGLGLRHHLSDRPVRVAFHCPPNTFGVRPEADGLGKPFVRAVRWCYTQSSAAVCRSFNTVCSYPVSN